MRRLVGESSRPKVWRWEWLATGVTYARISAGLMATTFYDRLTVPGISS
jgi:hypothetical protein